MRYFYVHIFHAHTHTKTYIYIYNIALLTSYPYLSLQKCLCPSPYYLILLANIFTFYVLCTLNIFQRSKWLCMSPIVIFLCHIGHSHLLLRWHIYKLLIVTLYIYILLYNEIKH